MCGIGGIINFDRSGSPKQQMAFVEQFLLIDVLRGEDGTGIASLPFPNTYLHGRDNNLVLYKKPVPGYDFIHFPQYKSIRNHVDDCKFTMLHNRKSTLGGDSLMMCHPFHINNITLMHNGTLHNHRALKGCTDIPSDSMALAFSLAKNGLEYTFEEAAGGAALAWYDQDTDEFNLYHNEDRPLAIAVSTTKKHIYFASEIDMLMMILNRCEVKYSSIYELPLDEIYTWKLGEAKDALDCTTSAVRLSTSKASYYNRYNYNEYGSSPNNFGKGGGSRHTAGKGPQGLMAKAGITYRDSIEFIVEEWEPYDDRTRIVNGKQQGRLHGWPVNDNGEVVYDFMVAVHSQDDKYKVGDRCVGMAFSARLSSIKSDGMDGMLIIVLDPKSITLVEDTRGNNTYPSVKGPGGIFISQSSYDDLTKGGCANCSAPLDSPTNTIWTADKSPLCTNCGEALEVYKH